MPRFVLLKHSMPELSERPTHWDFMLEAEGVLKTWALESAPSSRLEISAQQLADHRLAYLEIQGEISGGRGQVERVDCGSYEVQSKSAENWQITLDGEKLRGRVVLNDVNADQRWRFFFLADADLAGESSV